METEAEAKETISESQHIVQGPICEALHPDAVGTFDSSKGEILVETPVDSQHSFTETASQHVNIVREELTSKGHNNEAKDEKVCDVKGQLASETVDGNVTTTDAEMISDESTGNKVDAQAEDKQDEDQGETDSVKFGRGNEELSIKLEHETRSVSDESTTITESISGAEPLQNENSREPVWMMNKEELILESPLDLVNEKPEAEKLDRINEELHAKIEARTGISNDERSSMLVEEPSEKGNTQEPLEMTVKEDFELTKDEPEHGALDSSLDAVHDELEESETVNEEKNAKIEGEARIVDDERASYADSILVVESSEKEKKQESIEVAAARGLEPSQGVTEHDNLESPLDAVPEDIKGQEGKCELETMSKELVGNVEERPLDNKKKCEPIEKAAFENLQNMVSEASTETLIANKTNEKNTDDVGETTEGCEMHKTATIEEMSRDADDDIDQSVQEIEPENLEKANETMLEDQSRKKFGDAETTNFNISEDGVNLKEEIDTLYTSKAAIEENTGKTMNTEETSKPDQPDEKNEKVRDDDTHNDEVIVKYEESSNSVWEDQPHKTRISKDDTEISEFNEKTSGELELFSELAPEQNVQETMTGTGDTQSENPNIDKGSSEEICEIVEPNEDKENIKNEANENKDSDEHTLSAQEAPKGEEGQKNGEGPSSVNEDQIHQPIYTKAKIEVDISEAERETEQFKLMPASLPEDKWPKEAGIFDAIKFDRSTNDDNPNTMISVAANANEDIITATENDEKNLHTDKEDHSDSHRLISRVPSDQIGEHERASTTERQEQIYQANNDERKEVDIHREKDRSEELEIIVESIPKDYNIEDVTEPKAEDISDHSDDLQKEIPEISGHNDSPETAKMKDEDVLEKGICDVSDTHELVAETMYDGVDEKHEDAHQITNTEGNKEAAVQKEEGNIDINLDLGTEPEDQRQDYVREVKRMTVELTLSIDKDDEGSDMHAENAREATSGSDIRVENASEATSGLTLEQKSKEKSYKLEYDDKARSSMLEIRGEEVPMKEEVFDACLGASSNVEAPSNVVSRDDKKDEVEQVTRQIMQKEVETNGTVKEAKVAELVSQPDIETTNDNLYASEASLDKKMQDVSVVVQQKIHSAEEDNHIEVSAVLENQTKEEKEIHIRSQKDEMVDNQQEKENEAQGEKKSYESSNAGTVIENENFKDKETVENNSEEEKLEDNKPEKSPIVALEDFETATEAKDNHESETYKHGTKDVSEEIIQKPEDMMLTEPAIELGPGIQINSSIHITEAAAAIPSKEALKEEVLGACLGVSTHVEFKEPFMAEVEDSSQQLTEKEEATNGTDKEVKDTEMVSQMDIKTMGDTLHENEDSRDLNKQDASVEIENIQNAQEEDCIEVNADSKNETKEEKDATTSLIKQDLKDMPQEKEKQTEQRFYKSSEASETKEYESFRYKETAEDISRDIKDQDPERLPHVIGDLETASEDKAIHASEMEKQSTENNNKDFLKDEAMILVQSVTKLEDDNQNNKPIHSSEGPFPSAEASKEEHSDNRIGASANPSCNDPTAAEVKHLSQQITEKEEMTNGTDKEAKDDELISRTDIETAGDSLYVNETSHDKSMQDVSAVVEEKIRSSSEDKSIQTKGISENENKEKPDAQTSMQTDEPEDKKHKKVNELISQMDMETVGDSACANEASHDKHMQDAIVVVDEKIHGSSENKSIKTMVILDNENKEEPDVKTSIQNDESKEKKQENDHEHIPQTEMEIVGDFLHANEASCDKNMQDPSEIFEEKIQSSSGDRSTELTPQMDKERICDSLHADEASHDKNKQDASVGVEEKIHSSSEDNSTRITGTPENENEEEPDVQTSIQDDELTSQTDIETAGDTIYANEASRDNNIQDASEVVKEKLQSSSEYTSTETMSTLENENKEYPDVQTSIQKDEPEEQEKENEIQAEQKCNESQDASDAFENECLKEEVIANNSSQKEIMDDQEAEKLTDVVHDDLETTAGAKAVDVTETEQEGAENKNDENVRKCKDVMHVELVIELEHGNQCNKSNYSTEEASITSEEGVSSGDGLSKTTVAEAKHLTRKTSVEEEETNGTDQETSKEEVLFIRQGISYGDGLSETNVAEAKHLTEKTSVEEEETNGTDEEAKYAELLSQMDIQTMNNTSIANEASFDTNTQDASEEIEESPHGKHEDDSTETRAISEIESNEEKDVNTSLQKEQAEDKPSRTESDMQKEQEANEASDKNENQSFKDKVSADNYSEKENLEVQEPMKSPHVVLENPETVAETEVSRESETEKLQKENSNEEYFQKVEDLILVEPMFKLEPENQDNKPNYTTEGDIADEETLKAFNAGVEVESKIESTKPIVDEVEHLSQEMIKKEELIDEEAKEVELVSQVYTESTGDALYNMEAAFSKNMQDATEVVDEKILGTPEDNSIEVGAVSLNGNKEEQGVHAILQKEELEDKPVEKENGIQPVQKSYESCDVNETNKKDNFKYKETEEHNLEKEVLEDLEPENSPHVMDEDLETTRTEGIHESEAKKEGTENNSEEYFQKAEDLPIPKLATGIEPGKGSNYSIHTTDNEIPNEEALKEEVFDACQGVSSNIGTREPTIAEVENLSQIIDKDETSNDTDEKGKEVELVSEMNTETRSEPSLQANEASIDKSLQDSFLVVKEKTHSPSEDNSIEVMAFLRNENNEEQDVKENLREEEQEDMPQENEIEIQAEQISYELSNVCETIEKQSLKEKATTENNSVKEKLEDQESESPNVIHEETETAIGIHESETEKQVAENNNGENFLQGKDVMFAEPVTELDIGNEINKSIHTYGPEIPSEETLKEEVFDACQEMSLNTRLGKPIVAEMENLSQDMAAKEAATNRTNEVDKKGEFVSQSDVEPMGDTSCSNGISLETTIQDTSEVVEENMSTSDDSTIVVRAILKNENKEEHVVRASLQEEDLEVETQEKENKIPTEQKSHTFSDATETCRIESFKERESAASNSENEKLEDQEPDKSSQMVLEDLETANRTEHIHGSEMEKQDTESAIASEPDNTNNNSIHSTKGVAPIEEKTCRIDDVAKVNAHKGNRCQTSGGISVTHELIEESKHMEGQGPILQDDSMEIETHQKADQRVRTATQNDAMACSTEIVNIKLQEDVNEFMELDASADILFRNQERTIAKNIVSEEDTIETGYEQIQKDESEAKKDELGTDSIPNIEVEENDCRSLKQTATMMDSSGNLGTSSIVASLADETEKEVDEKFSKISDYWPARYNEEASNVNVVDREHQEEISSVGGQSFGVDKFTSTPDSTDASKLDASKVERETLNEVPNLASKEEIHARIGSSAALTEGKKNPHEQSAMQEPEVKQPMVPETEHVISNASNEIKLESLQEKVDDLPVSQFLMKHVLGEEADPLNKNCEEECEDVTNIHDARDNKNEVDIPVQEETSKPEDNAGCEKLQNSYKSPQPEENVDAENNSEGKVAKDGVTLQRAFEGSTSKLAVIEDEIATVLSDKSVHTAIDDSMELTSTDDIIPEIKLDGKPCSEADLVQDEKIQASVFEETVAEKDIQKDILQKETDEESKEQLPNAGNVEVSEDKLEVVECGEERKDIGTQIHISKKDSEEDLKLSKSQENKRTDLGIESTLHSLKRDENLIEDKNLAVMVETTDDKGGVNKTDEDKYGEEEMDVHKPEKSSNDATTTESMDSELKPTQKDDQTNQSLESPITNGSKLNKILELQSEDDNKESAETTPEVIDKSQGRKKNVTTEEIKLSVPQIVQQSDLEMDEDHSVLSTEIKVDEDKTDHETTTEATDSELTPIQKDDRTMKPFESSIAENLELRSDDNNEESADKKQDVIHQNEGQMTNVMTEEQKLSESQIVQQLDLAMDEEHSVKSIERKVDEDKTDDENDEKEEEDEHKPEEPGHDAEITVESRDAEVTPTKKKSHGILSGVGSKVKHSIAKVKKAITGKSSHSKAPSAK